MKTKLLLAVALLAAALGSTLRAQSTDSISSTAYEAGHAIKASPGTLIHLQGYNSKGSAQFIQIHNTGTVPSDAVTGVAEISTVDFTGITAASLANKYFLVSGASARYSVWFNLDAGGVDPAVASTTAVPVAIATGDSATVIGAAVATALDALASLAAAADTGVVTITDAATGARTDIAAGNSTAAVAVTQQGVTAIAATVPILVITVAATSNFSFTLPNGGMYLSGGISVCNSSTATTKTAGSADCFFTAIFR